MIIVWFIKDVVANNIQVSAKSPSVKMCQSKIGLVSSLNVDYKDLGRLAINKMQVIPLNNNYMYVLSGWIM